MAGSIQKRIFVPTKSTAQWQALLADPGKHWREGFSAKMLAERWESAPGNLPAEIREVLGTAKDFDGSSLELIAAFPEIKTALPGGSTASQTDLFAIVATGDRLLALGVEGKVDESFGKIISDWKTESPGKLSRLHYLWNLLGLQQEPAGTIRYQLMHRAAATILEARRFRIDTAILLVHSFARRHSGFEDFVAWCGLFGKTPVQGALLHLADLDGTTFHAAWVSGPPAQ
jgi:hypothetical protein